MTSKTFQIFQARETFSQDMTFEYGYNVLYAYKASNLK
jgi:hypothetical protein